MSEFFCKAFSVFWVEDVLDSVLILKMIPLAFRFYHNLSTPHTDKITRVVLGPTSVHSHLYQTVSVCEHRHMSWPQCLKALLLREVLYVRIKISLMKYAILLRFLMEVKPAFPSYPSSAVGRLWTRQAAWNAEWQTYREVVWQPVIFQKCLFSRICHISSLSPHFKMEKRQKYLFFSTEWMLMIHAHL